MEDRKRSISSNHSRLPSKGRDQLTPPWETRPPIAITSSLHDRTSTSNAGAIAASPGYPHSRGEAERPYDTQYVVPRNPSQERPSSSWQTSQHSVYGSPGFAPGSINLTGMTPAWTTEDSANWKALPPLPQAPPSPPESKSDASSSVHSSPATQAMPGTMSSRTRSHSEDGKKPRSRSRRTAPRRTTAEKLSPRVDATEQAAVGPRLKLAFRGFFKKDTVKDSDFERIEESHWADE